MKNKLLTLILSIFLISFVSSMYAGSNYTFELETTDNLFWDVEGNSSNMEGFSVYQEIIDGKSVITFSAVENMKPDNFTIILYSNTSSEIEVVKEITSSSGGGGRTIIKKVNITEHVEVPNYITEYVDNKTIEYVQNETICPDDDKITFKEFVMNKVGRSIILGASLILIYLILYSCRKLFKKSRSSENLKDIDERRLKK